MHLYMSGTPRNDPYQTVENRLCTHRLFSMHGDYEKAVLRWVKDLSSGILDADAFLRAHPHHLDLIKKRDANRRTQQRDFGRTFDWDTAEVLENVCKRLKGRPYPKAILLDSGAFTAWNKGEKTTVDDVKRKYSRFMEAAGDMFDEIWMINLDVIPGERGRDPTLEELDEAVRVSDINFEILVKEFGNRILPVFHQGESTDRLAECVAQVDGKSNYICVSPRNDLPERQRVKWSGECHRILGERWPHIMTHGLATTGNNMLKDVPWYSGDSAAWVQHGGFGMVDIFHPSPFDDVRSGKQSDHYMNYFVSFDGVEYQFHGGDQILSDGRVLNMAELGLSPTILNANGKVVAGSTRRECAEALTAFGVHPDEFPLTGKHFSRERKIKRTGDGLRTAAKHYFECTPAQKAHIDQRIAQLGFETEIAMWDSRVRNLICMHEMRAFAERSKQVNKKPAQIDLLSF